MASESVARIDENEPPEAITEWCDDMQWKRLDGRLPMGAWRRLMSIDRCVSAQNRIAEMLFANELGRNDMEDSGATFKPMCPIDAQALALANLELGARAEKLLEELRDGRFA